MRLHFILKNEERTKKRSNWKFKRNKNYVGAREEEKEKIMKQEQIHAFNVHKF